MPTLKPPKPGLRGRLREQAVQKTIKVLNGWVSSPFEFEGAARAGIRSALCVNGARWSIADADAEAIVAEGLSAIGAKRPSWEDGQARYIDRGDFCAHCFRPMPDDLVTGGRNFRFCSSECTRAAYQERVSANQISNDSAMSEIYNTIARENQDNKKCLNCGKEFKQISKYNIGKFCSRGCASSARRRKEMTTCLACGTNFISKKGIEKACSRKCASEFGWTTRYDRVCAACGEMFVSKKSDGMFCSKNCRCFSSNMSTSRKVPHSITARLFDYLFSAPIALDRSAKKTEHQANGYGAIGIATPLPALRPREVMYLTAGLFDRLFVSAA